MRLGPFEISRVRQKAAVPMTTFVPNSSSWWPVLREGFSGAWQRGVVTPLEDAATHPVFWSCLTLIANDVAKMRPMLMDYRGAVPTEVVKAGHPFTQVLEKPNHYQNRIQFIAYWILCKLTRGNAYAIKERDDRGVVNALYLLDPMRVRPLVTPNGDVYYAVGQDLLSGLTSTSLVVPAREIIHDMWNAIYHPLVGLSPVYAAGMSAMLGLKIGRNTSAYADHGQMMGGLLTTDSEISAETAKTLADQFNSNYLGPENAGKIAVIGNGLKYAEPKILTAVDSQIIDQLKWSDEKICGTLHVPGYMVQVGPVPTNNNVDALGQQYYGQCLQTLVESFELCMTEGCEVDPYEVEMDIEALDRMDTAARVESATKGITGGLYKPNEARAKFRLQPVNGGDQVFMQKQNWPLDILGSDSAPPTPEPVAEPPDDDKGGPEPPPPAKELDETELLAKALLYLEAA